MTRRLALAAALGASALFAAPAGAQQLAARFEITAVGDSTFTFAHGAQTWVAARGRGIVVDPARRDALVARFRIIGVNDGVVTALVTGQSARVTDQHFAVVNPPPPPRWYQRGAFWTGTAAGAVVGTLIGGLLL